MAKIVQVGRQPWRAEPQTDPEVFQVTYDRLCRKYKGLDAPIIRAAWRRHLGSEPTDQIIEGIRTGRRLRFT
jgi:hypothetical protein